MNTRINIREVSVIGLGLMGSTLATALIEAGHNVTVWNRTAAKANPLLKKGAHLAQTVAEAIERAELTLICLKDHETTMELIEEVGAAENKTLVQLSTMAKDQSIALAEWAEARGFAYLDGAILGPATAVSEGHAMIIFSGPKEKFLEYEHVLAALGTPKHLSSDVGACLVFDRVWYAYGFTVSMAFLQGAAMAKASGFSLDVFFEIVQARLPSFADQLKKRGEVIQSGNFETSDARLEVWSHAFEGTLATCRDLGVDDALPATIMDMFNGAIDAGYGDEDLAAVFKFLTRASQAPLISSEMN